MTEESADQMGALALRGERVLIVLAGPNGAGKSTFYETFLAATGIRFVNADLIAQAIGPDDPSSVSYAAAQIAEQERRLLLAEGMTLCMETVFSDPVGDKVQFLRDAQAAGYTVFLVFVAVENAELSIARVMQRVEEGGHDVPDDKIKARFPRAIKNLCQAVTFVDHALLFDNSSCAEPFRHVATFEDGELVRRSETVPEWAKSIPGLK